MQIGYVEFRNRVLALTGWDLDCYKGQQLERRLKALVVRTKVSGLREYAGLLEKEPSRVRELSDLLTINVSEFFRNPDRFDFLETKIIPSLPSQAPSIWSAGCANGSEPYTLAMLMQKAGIKRYSILATDIDQNILDRAQAASYTTREIESLPKHFKNQYFETKEDQHVAKQALKIGIRFQKHNLLADTYPRNFDLIVCRNVLIYFTDAAKNMVVSKFLTSLKPGGYLFVGSTETIFNATQIGYKNVAPFFYQRPGGKTN